MAVNFEYYRVFYYVAKYRNLTRAAEALFSSQPNVSRVMNHLEDELGCQLLIRSNKGITLTVEGERLYQHVAAACEQLQMGEDELTQSVGLQSGTVRIGASETALHLYLLDRLRVFHEQYPNVRLKIFNYSTPQAIAALRNGQVDFSVVTTPADNVSSFQEIRLRTFQDILAGGPRFETFSEKEHFLKEISEYSLISLEKDTNTYEFYDHLYRDHGLTFQPDVEVATADLVLPMIRNNLGLGFLPREFAGDALRERRIYEIRLREKIPPRYVCLVYDAKRGFGVAAKELKRMLCEGRPIESQKGAR
jgi:DNA-binding transcriptional LysR family regulator